MFNKALSAPEICGSLTLENQPWRGKHLKQRGTSRRESFLGLLKINHDRTRRNPWITELWLLRLRLVQGNHFCRVLVVCVVEIECLGFEARPSEMKIFSQACVRFIVPMGSSSSSACVASFGKNAVNLSLWPTITLRWLIFLVTPLGPVAYWQRGLLNKQLCLSNWLLRWFRGLELSLWWFPPLLYHSRPVWFF